MAIGFWFIRCATLSFVITSIRVDAAATDPDEEVYVSDRYGNKIFKDGTVRFVSPIPVGDDTYLTKLDYDTKGLGTLYAFARSFLEDVMPLDFPFGKGDFALKPTGLFRAHIIVILQFCTFQFLFQFPKFFDS